MHTAFLTDIPAPDGIVELNKREYDHLFKTLRCRPGEQLHLCDGKGTIALAEATADRCVKVLEKTILPPDRIEIYLFAALPKNAKLDSLLKPVTEAGVKSITPLKCRYSVVEKSAIPERWHTLLEEACKQSGNPFLPEITPTMTTAEAVKYCQENNITIFFGDQHGTFLTPDDLASQGTVKMAWMVGPEGGFDADEQALLKSAGKGITLGRYIFRLENAALAGVSYLMTLARTAEIEK